MRVWWLFLVATLVGLGAILLTAPEADGGWTCKDATAQFLLSSTQDEGGPDPNPSVGQSACSEAAWARVPFALGVAVVGGGLTGLTRRRR